MRLLMINDDWGELPKDHPVKLAFDAGEPTPLKGIIYTCVGVLNVTERSAKTKVRVNTIGK
jgi:hypothetical protein